MKVTKVLLSSVARDRIRKASSGLTGEEWALIPMDEKKEYIKMLELVVEDIMLTEPDAFTRRAIAHAKETRDRRMARKFTHVQGKVQVAV